MCLKVPGASSEDRLLCHSSVHTCSLLFSFLIRIHPFSFSNHQTQSNSYISMQTLSICRGWLVGWRECGFPVTTPASLTYNQLSNRNLTHLRWPRSCSNVNTVVFFGGFRHAGEFSCSSGWSSNSYKVASKMAQELKALNPNPGRASSVPWHRCYQFGMVWQLQSTKPI